MFLYAVNEISNFNGTTSGAVSAFAISPSNGNLTFLNSVSSEGAGPAHLSVDRSGHYVLVANYGGGNVAVVPILSNGALSNATDVKNDVDACLPACPVGPLHALDAPPCSFAISGHSAPHAHMICTDPAGNFVLVNDVGLDRTLIWKFDRATGKLSDPKAAASSAGAGPRHFAFHPNGRFFYSLNEEASTIMFSNYDAAIGSLQPQQELSTLPHAFVGTSFTSEVIVSPDGRFVYAANRLHDSIAIFVVGGTGKLTRVGEVWTQGDYPYHINIDPTGNFLYACNQMSDNLTVFHINKTMGRLAFTNQYTCAGNPTCIVFLSI